MVILLRMNNCLCDQSLYVSKACKNQITDDQLSKDDELFQILHYKRIFN